MKSKTPSKDSSTRANKSPKQQRNQQKRNTPKTVASRQSSANLTPTKDDSAIKAKSNSINMGAGERIQKYWQEVE